MILLTRELQAPSIGLIVPCDCVFVKQYRYYCVLIWWVCDIASHMFWDAGLKGGTFFDSATCTDTAFSLEYCVHRFIVLLLVRVVWSTSNTDTSSISLTCLAAPTGANRTGFGGAKQSIITDN